MSVCYGGASLTRPSLVAWRRGSPRIIPIPTMKTALVGQRPSNGFTRCDSKKLVITPVAFQTYFLSPIPGFIAVLAPRFAWQKLPVWTDSKILGYYTPVGTTNEQNQLLVDDAGMLSEDSMDLPAAKKAYSVIYRHAPCD